MVATAAMADRRLVAWLDERPEWHRRILAFVLGALGAFALPPFHVVPVLFLCFPVLLLLTSASRCRVSAFAQGWWFGLGHFAAGLYWVGIAFVVNEDVSNLGAPFAVGLLAGVLAFFPGLATLLFYQVRQWLAERRRALNGFGLILLFALTWSLTEWLRGHAFTGFPWNLVGYSWAAWDAPVQIVSLVGVYGLGLITMIIVLAPVAVVRECRPWSRWAPAAAALLLIGMVFGGGLVRLPDGPARQTDIELRLVQANIAQQDKWRSDRISDNFIRYLELSRKPRRVPADVIIWPETAAAYFLEQEPSRRFLMADTVPEDGYIITGAPRIRRGPGDEIKLWNSLHAIDRFGQVVATYDKVHLVPFGEYLPFRSILESMGLTRFVPSAFDFTPGEGFKTIDLAGVPPFSPLICYEIIFPGAVALDQAPPAWLLNLTNDAWYGESTGPYQHLVTARFRAVEEGVPVVRVAGTGISAVIDPYGRVVKSLGLNKGGIIDVRLPERVEYRTLYARIGDWSFAVLMAIIALLALSGACVRRDGGVAVV
ncbi:MAG: apolipoprotein N-acyltransferase [Alphaproteobacteria bacterium]|nr:MAG: apolipoprotein N-acyltransferase [Alphaproteobacteria bacterium]